MMDVIPSLLVGLNPRVVFFFFFADISHLAFRNVVLSVMGYTEANIKSLAYYSGTNKLSLQG